MKPFLALGCLLVVGIRNPRPDRPATAATTPQSMMNTTGSVRHNTLNGPGARLLFADSAGLLFARPLF